MTVTNFRLISFYIFLDSTLNPSIHLLKSSLISSTPIKEGNDSLSSEAYTYCAAHEPNYFSESMELKGEVNIQSSEEPYYNRMVKKPMSSRPVKNQSLVKENWNSLYSDVDFNPCQNYCKPTSHQSIKPENKTRDNISTIDNCSIRNNFSLNSNHLRQATSVDPSYVKVPWHEYENNNSNVVDITHWIMNTLSSAIRLKFLDLSGLDTYISQIILLIKLITTTSGVNNKAHDSLVTSSLLAIPSSTAASSTSSSAESNRYFIDGQPNVCDKNGLRLKEKRFSDIVGVIKGKKHLKNYSSNGYVRQEKF